MSVWKENCVPTAVGRKIGKHVHFKQILTLNCTTFLFALVGTSRFHTMLPPCSCSSTSSNCSVLVSILLHRRNACSAICKGRWKGIISLEYYVAIQRFLNTAKQLCSNHLSLIPYLYNPNVHRLTRWSYYYYSWTWPLGIWTQILGRPTWTFSLSMSTNRHAHSYTAQVNFARYWLLRITHTFHITKDSSTDKNRECYRALFNFLAACVWSRSIEIYHNCRQGSAKSRSTSLSLLIASSTTWWR